MKNGENNIKNLLFVCGVVLVAALLVLSTMRTPESSAETAGNILQVNGNDETTFLMSSEVPDETVEIPSETPDETVEIPSEVPDETVDSSSEELPESAPESAESILEAASSAEWAESPQVLQYTFRNERLLNQHYEKHGIEMGFATIEEYVAAANAVINHPDVLHKKEAEDNDDVYFLEATSEFVVVSTDGYIRTYFIPSGGIDYYNRQ